MMTGLASQKHREMLRSPLSSHDEIIIDFTDDYLLPEEIIERVASGMNFSYHLVEVSAKFVYAYLLAC